MPLLHALVRLHEPLCPTSFTSIKCMGLVLVCYYFAHHRRRQKQEIPRRQNDLQNASCRMYLSIRRIKVKKIMHFQEVPEPSSSSARNATFIDVKGRKATTFNVKKNMPHPGPRPNQPEFADI